LGGEVKRGDLTTRLDESIISFLKAEWAKHGVLVFHSQIISDQDHVRFARNFGQLQTFVQGSGQGPIIPEIFRSANVDERGNLLPSNDEWVKMLKLNWLWHTDSSYRSIPAKGVILRAIQVPSEGGDTIFANNAAAFEALPTAMKKRIEGLVSSHNFACLVRQQDFPPLSPDEEARLPRIEHPLVRQHADGRRSLYLSPPYMERILGWSQADSLELIEELTDWATRERFVYRHQWRPYDVIMWDNGWTMHKVMPYDLDRDKRIVHGTTILGTEHILPIT
jgi:alpha-ketoglutarate-dependent taurine dioxygenase